MGLPNSRHSSTVDHRPSSSARATISPAKGDHFASHDNAHIAQSLLANPFRVVIAAGGIEASETL
eukprot:scaffold80206_cov27-Tisochrysis_lutea.AAC.6